MSTVPDASASGGCGRGTDRVGQPIDGCFGQDRVRVDRVPEQLENPREWRARRRVSQWGWHIVDAVRQEALRNPDPKLEALAEELATMAPPLKASTAQHVGVRVPLRLRWGEDELRLLSTLTHFGTAVDVTVAELKLEAFLPADAPTTALLHQRDRDVAPTLSERREEAIAKRALTRRRE